MITGVGSAADAEPYVLRRDRPHRVQQEEEGHRGACPAAGHQGDQPQRQTPVRGE